jgi:zinc/manganese transport system substrate-binding protein
MMKAIDSMPALARHLRRLTQYLAAGAAVVALSHAALAQNAPTAAQTSAPVSKSASTSVSERIPVVAAENFYGDVVHQLGGDHVDVVSVLGNPDQDPHLFEASPKTARALHHARLVVYNGADYDPWIEKLLGASKASKNAPRTVIVAADLTGKKAGGDPHVWYDPATMPALARAVSAALIAADPAHRADYDANLAKFLASLKPLDAKIAALRTRYSGVPVTATEPVFGYMSDAIGLSMRNQRFQFATMNETEVSAADIAAFERDLREKRVRVLVYNSQAGEALAERMLELARQAGVPTVSVTETAPVGKTYQQWMSAQLDALAAALEGKRP